MTKTNSLKVAMERGVKEFSCASTKARVRRTDFVEAAKSRLLIPVSRRGIKCVDNNLKSSFMLEIIIHCLRQVSKCVALASFITPSALRAATRLLQVASKRGMLYKCHWVC